MVTAIRKTSAWPLAAQLAFTFVATVGVFLIQFPLELEGLWPPVRFVPFLRFHGRPDVRPAIRLFCRSPL